MIILINVPTKHFKGPASQRKGFVMELIIVDKKSGQSYIINNQNNSIQLEPIPDEVSDQFTQINMVLISEDHRTETYKVDETDYAYLIKAVIDYQINEDNHQSDQ